MVKVELHEEKDSPSGSPYSSDAASSAASSSSSLSSLSTAPDDETLADRLAALIDIVPPTTRHNIASRTKSAGRIIGRVGKIAGNVVWVVTTSALLVGLPLALCLEDEAKIVAQEKEMLAQQQGAQQMLGGASGQQQQQKGLVPPGF